MSCGVLWRLCDNHIANKSWTERKHTIILG
uniref:Uncharacterized protein n=1 Tax=Siphoviridae sp. ct5jB2 TaxID=2825337 RepID=A0A8S5TTL7_9CAUD|nr:MAG TPA: hypothetical protein [Siphoviridae sp. ct5jB2]